MDLTKPNTSGEHEQLLSSSGFSAPAFADKLIRRQRAKLRRAMLWAMVCVGVPTLLSSVYFALFAADIYVSSATLAVRSINENKGIGGLFGDALGASFGIQPSSDASLVVNYMTSHDMLRRLSQSVDFQAIYGSDLADWPRRLAADATFEERLEYFRKMVDVRFDIDTKLVELKVRAFSSDAAKAVAEQIIVLAEDLVNDMSTKIRDDSLAFATQELATAEARLIQARRDVTEFRNHHGELDPVEGATTVNKVLAEVYGQIIAARAELAQARGVMRDDSPQLKALKDRVAALETQLAKERTRLTGEEHNAYSQLMARYTDLLTQEEFATSAYKIALASLEEAKREAARQHVYLLAFVPPQMAQEAQEPRRVKGVATVFVVALFAFGICSLLIAAVREHAKV